MSSLTLICVIMFLSLPTQQTVNNKPNILHKSHKNNNKSTDYSMKSQTMS